MSLVQRIRPLRICCECGQRSRDYVVVCALCTESCFCRRCRDARIDTTQMIATPCCRNAICKRCAFAVLSLCGACGRRGCIVCISASCSRCTGRYCDACLRRCARCACDTLCPREFPAAAAVSAAGALCTSCETALVVGAELTETRKLIRDEHAIELQERASASLEFNSDFALYRSTETLCQ